MRDLPQNIYLRSGDTAKKYLVQVGRWYFNVKVGAFYTLAEAEAALEAFVNEFGTLTSGPNSSRLEAFRVMFPGVKTKTITLADYRIWRNALRNVSAIEFDIKG